MKLYELTMIVDYIVLSIVARLISICLNVYVFFCMHVMIFYILASFLLILIELWVRGTKEFNVLFDVHSQLEQCK